MRRTIQKYFWRCSVAFLAISLLVGPHIAAAEEDYTSQVLADNNLAERELRPLVIARKISFGSQSDAGVRTREILMTVLHTLKKRTTTDVTSAFKSALDKLAKDGDIEPYEAVFSFDSS
jgi:hypothetical protein